MKLRTQRAVYLFSVLIVQLAFSARLAAQIPDVAGFVVGKSPMEGLFTLYWDESSGRMYWEFDDLESEFIHQVSMASGLGSNPIGIDRGQLGETRVLQPKRVGPRVLLIEKNYRYRAASDNALEREAVEDAFAPSVMWGFDIVAADADSILVDATDFFLRDVRDVTGRIQSRDQGAFRLDESRSAFFLERTRAFPENVEVEVMLTFVSDEPGDLVRAVAASGNSITLRQHHSLVKLPDDDFEPRFADPRIGTNGPTIQDYSTDIDQDMRVRLVARHRLQKKDPAAERSEPVEPIIYYVDPGTPEPIRSALIEGASWWNEAYEAAGFIDAFQVMELPEGADAQDVRYNMIHWTHRRTRGYSYGNSVMDPRTGEIIKGNVNLGSLRLRQDYLMGQGMVPGFDYLDVLADSSASVKLALDRVRQLSAHEVGHTLGFPHNYLGSTFDRETVMDYPAPLVEIDAQGKLDFSNAYVQRIGEYDKLAVRYSYTQFLPGADESVELAKIVRESLDSGYIYMAHDNNNFRGAGHPYASVWDNGADLVEHLAHEIEVRRIGLESFGLGVIREGEPVSTLENVLLPLYMHHRFQLNAAAQSIGGADYRNAVRGDGQVPLAIIDGAQQRYALQTVLSTLSVDFLALPPNILELLPPPADRFDQGETFPGRTGLLFDPLGTAEAAVSFTVRTLLHPARMSRLMVYGSMGDFPDLEEVVDGLLEETFRPDPVDDAYRQMLSNVVRRVTVDEMMRQASSADVSGEVKAVLADRLDSLASNLERQRDVGPYSKALVAGIRHWQQRTDAASPDAALQMPAGDPI